MTPLPAYYEPAADWSLIPEHMREGVIGYVMRGWEPGSFLYAALANDFMDAAARADDQNLAALGRWARFIYNFTPSRCHGSPEAVDAWIAKGGLLGHET